MFVPSKKYLILTEKVGIQRLTS